MRTAPAPRGARDGSGAIPPWEGRCEVATKGFSGGALRGRCVVHLSHSLCGCAGGQVIFRSRQQVAETQKRERIPGTERRERGVQVGGCPVQFPLGPLQLVELVNGITPLWGKLTD